MLLATDLDGTFLGGKMQDRLELYRMIRQNPKIKLVFVTGRGIETVIPLLNNPIIPTPDYVISDVGSTIVNGHTLENVEPLQSQIEAKWPPCLWSGSTGTENRWYQQAGSSPTKKKLLLLYRGYRS